MLSIATFTLINRDCSDCHLQLIEDIDNINGIVDSDGFISDDNSIIIINLTYNSKIISINEINQFIALEGFALYTK